MVMSVNFSPSTFIRRASKAPPITLLNRYAEQDPILNDGPVSLLSRPRLKKFITVGEGHIRKCFAPPGIFNDDLFVVSGTELYRVQAGGTSSLLGVISSDTTGDVSMAATAPIGDVPSYLFIAEGGVLWVYTTNGQSLGHLTVTANPSAGEVVNIDTVYYAFDTLANVDAGSPAGTAGNPWKVVLGATLSVSLTNLYNAINASGTPGTDYSTALTTAPTTFYASAQSGGNLYVVATANGSGGNTIPTTETLVDGSWADSTLTGGGSESIRQVQVPDGVGALSIAHINSYVIVVPVQTDETRGRFYWIKPGEAQIDALDFATAERSPDGILQVVVFGDYFWLLGQDTTEPWITTSDPDVPMARFQGILYDRGSIEGTGIQVKDGLIVIDQDGGVFRTGDGSERISTPDIEERIQRAVQKALLLGTL